MFALSQLFDLLFIKEYSYIKLVEISLLCC